MSTNYKSSYIYQANNGATKRILIINFCLALLPVFSFLGQYFFSKNAGTEHILFHHQTVMIVDWIFIPFNFWVISTIDWNKGFNIYIVVIVSVVLNIATHAFWQYNKLDPGHMITNAGIILPAGWVHLAFSTLETILLIAFVFCRKAEASKIILVTLLGTLYFLTMGICGYIMHQKFILSDVIVVASGLFFILIYPLIRLHKFNTKE
jgi:hypothetical protein